VGRRDTEDSDRMRNGVEWLKLKSMMDGKLSVNSAPVLVEEVRLSEVKMMGYVVRQNGHSEERTF